MSTTQFWVGSSNPVKVGAVNQVVLKQWPDAQIKGVEVKSSVSEQPRGDAETRAGALNRARAALEIGLSRQSDPTSVVIGVGLEGGVLEHEDGRLWSTVWVVVVEPSGKIWEANGARFPLPSVIAEPIRSGQEMGPVVAGISGIPDVRKQQGMIGVITNNFTDRTTEYASIVSMAIGQWYGQAWFDTP